MTTNFEIVIYEEVAGFVKYSCTKIFCTLFSSLKVFDLTSYFSTYFADSCVIVEA